MRDRALKGYIAATAGSDDTSADHPSLSRRPDEARYFPHPATLRELSGQTMTDDAGASEAQGELFKIVAAMRGAHGPKLKDIPARDIGTDDSAKVCRRGLEAFGISFRETLHASVL
jgi:hypothetical protein